VSAHACGAAKFTEEVINRLRNIASNLSNGKRKVRASPSLGCDLKTLSFDVPIAMEGVGSVFAGLLVECGE
jgi:hypothetical protein